MNAKMVFSFAFGAVVGVFAGAYVTKKRLEKAYRELADDEIQEAYERYSEDLDKMRELDKELREEIRKKDITIETLMRHEAGESGANTDLGESKEDKKDEKGGDNDDADPDIRRKERERVLNIADRAGYRYNMAEKEEIKFPIEEEFEEADPPKTPYLISEEEYSEKNLDFEKLVCYFYPYDGTIVTEDGEELDNYATILGNDWGFELETVGDTAYIRNEKRKTDALIMLKAGCGLDHVNLYDDEED